MQLQGTGLQLVFFVGAAQWQCVERYTFSELFDMATLPGPSFKEHGFSCSPLVPLNGNAFSEMIYLTELFYLVQLQGTIFQLFSFGILIKNVWKITLSLQLTERLDMCTARNDAGK